jgi:hypothetical protein
MLSRRSPIVLEAKKVDLELLRRIPRSGLTACGGFSVGAASLLFPPPTLPQKPKTILE